MILKKNRLISIVMIFLLFVALVPEISQKAYGAEGDRAKIEISCNINGTVTNAEGKTLKWDSKTGPSGTMMVYGISGSDGDRIGLEVDASNSFTYVPQKTTKEVYLAVLFGSTIYGRASATNADSITVSLSDGIGNVIVKGNNTTFLSKILARNNDTYDVWLYGTTNGTATLSDTPDGIVVSGTDGAFTLRINDMKGKPDSVRTGVFALIEDNALFDISGKKIRPISGVARPCTCSSIQVKHVRIFTIDDSTAFLTWSKVKTAKGYRVYKYDTVSKTYKKLKDCKGQKTNFYYIDNLESEKAYKYKVQPYKVKNGKKVFLKCSYYVSAIIGSATIGNAIQVTMDQSGTVKKKAGKTLQLKATVATEAGKTLYSNNVRWVCSNKKIATVDKNGKVKFKKKGTCYIRAKAHNGKNSERIKIVVL